MSYLLVSYWNHPVPGPSSHLDNSDGLGAVFLTPFYYSFLELSLGLSRTILPFDITNGSTTSIHEALQKLLAPLLAIPLLFQLSFEPMPTILTFKLLKDILHSSLRVLS